MNPATTSLFATPPDPSALRAMDLHTRTRIIESWLCRELGHVLDVPPAHRVSPHRPLRGIGVDSLLALCLKRRLELELDVRIKTHDLLRDDTVSEIAALLAQSVTEPAPAVAYGMTR
ncbi:acyl carrier protein [Streptomyces sp. NBC_00243]|uniref:acyl carrier protein n=1 Tax=Streptomyces sp. NBC_00243 TaxID=2975688 RepID=UPI002DD8C2B0|nr:acyl carrier protein [Streptomyces sp. NBC_00243]WRZ17029.1 acyl carrier protein [Streptomyces sp. NBC_00243]WRZ25635.1 acyl carrier protein [Streptomyces sp. NBC_00243]